MLWPSYSHRLHTAILRTNRQIHHEAKYLTRHENLFVLIRGRHPHLMEFVCRHAGISFVTSKDRGLGHCVMSIDLALVYSNGPATDYLMCHDQLSSFCEGMHFHRKSFLLWWQTTATCHISQAEN